MRMSNRRWKKENAEMKNKMMKMRDEKDDLRKEKVEFLTKLVEKTKECGDLKLKVKEMDTKIGQSNEEKTELYKEKAELLAKLLEKTEECSELNLKVKEMDKKIEKLEETMNELKKKDRETVYAMIDGGSFEEIYKMDCKLLRWIEEIVQIFRLSYMPKWTVNITPQQFMQYLSDGYMLFRLASILGNDQISPIPNDAKKCYEYFH